MNKVTILSGPSGIGKTTFANTLLADDDMLARSCSANSFFMNNGEFRFDPRDLPLAHAKCFKSFITALEAGVEHIIIDNTNTTFQEISPYVLGAQAFGYRHELKIFTLAPDVEDFDRCVYALAQRSVHGVRESTIRKQLNNIQCPPSYWNWERINVEV